MEVVGVVCADFVAVVLRQLSFCPFRRNNLLFSLTSFVFPPSPRRSSNEMKQQLCTNYNIELNNEFFREAKGTRGKDWVLQSLFFRRHCTCLCLHLDLVGGCQVDC